MSHGVGTLYHYTSLETFQRIVESKMFWASSVHYLNDARESHLGLEMLAQQAERESERTKTDEKAFLIYLAAWLTRRGAYAQNIFVLCFSEARDQLSQWRGYTPHGAGVCVGIQSGILVAQMQKLGWQFQRCRYRHSEQLEFVNAVLTQLRRAAANRDARIGREDHFSVVIESRVAEIWQVAAMIKEEGFSEEAEVRFMSAPMHAYGANVRYRPGKSTLIPFVEFPIPDAEGSSFVLDEVIVGPTPTEFLSTVAISGFFAKHRVQVRAGIRGSRIPYRQL